MADAGQFDRVVAGVAIETGTPEEVIRGRYGHMGKYLPEAYRHARILTAFCLVQICGAKLREVAPILNVNTATAGTMNAEAMTWPHRRVLLENVKSYVRLPPGSDEKPPALSDEELGAALRQLAKVKLHAAWILALASDAREGEKRARDRKAVGRLLF